MHCVLIKRFNTFMYDHTLHPARKRFCRYCLYAFSTEEISKRHISNCFNMGSITLDLQNPVTKPSIFI